MKATIDWRPRMAIVAQPKSERKFRRVSVPAPPPTFACAAAMKRLFRLPATTRDCPRLSDAVEARIPGPEELHPLASEGGADDSQEHPGDGKGGEVGDHHLPHGGPGGGDDQVQAD